MKNSEGSPLIFTEKMVFCLPEWCKIFLRNFRREKFSRFYSFLEFLERRYSSTHYFNQILIKVRAVVEGEEAEKMVKEKLTHPRIQIKWFNARVSYCVGFFSFSFHHCVSLSDSQWPPFCSYLFSSFTFGGMPCRAGLLQRLVLRMKAFRVRQFDVEVIHFER